LQIHTEPSINDKLSLLVDHPKMFVNPCLKRHSLVTVVSSGDATFTRIWEYSLQLEYLDATVLRRGVGGIRIVGGRDPACWQGWRDVCSHWKQTNDLSQHPSTFRNGLGEPLRSFSWTVSSKYNNYRSIQQLSERGSFPPWRGPLIRDLRVITEAELGEAHEHEWYQCAKPRTYFSSLRKTYFTHWRLIFNTSLKIASWC
jgi:hypothetical protein